MRPIYSRTDQRVVSTGLHPHSKHDWTLTCCTKLCGEKHRGES